MRQLITATATSLTWPEKKLYEIGVLDKTKLSLPDFLIIGAPKAGTWWLAHNLFCHPEVFLATGEKQAELHYFDAHFHHRLKMYSDHFAGHNNLVKGEKTPAYCLLPIERIHFMNKIMPEARYLFIIRHPIERAWSHAMMDLVRKPGVPFAQVDKERIVYHLRTTGQRFNYNQILDNWLNVIPPERFLILFFEDLIQNPQKLLLEAFSFLNLSTDVDWSSFPYNQKINQGPKAIMPKAYRQLLEDVYREDVNRLEQRLGRSLVSL